MTDDNKKQLPYVLYGLRTKISSLFFQKLILFDQQILQAKHLRHYDYQCQGLVNLIKFLQRKNNKSILYTLQVLKNYKLDQQKSVQEFQQIVSPKGTKQIQLKSYKMLKQGNITTRTKFFTRANTSIQQSDNSFIFSPNVKKLTPKAKSQYLNNTFTDGNRSIILQKLLSEVKKVNAESYQQSLKPAKSSYFNLTLGGKQSLQTFQNNCNCNCNCHNFTSNCKNQNKQMKRRKIIQKFQKIQRKIYDSEPIEQQFYGRKYHQKQRRQVVYSVYQPSTFRQKPNVTYITPNTKRQQYTDFIDNFGLSTTKSVANFNYSKKVFI